MKVSVVGLGYIGLPTGIVLAANGNMVYGYDVNQKAIESLKNGKIHIKENDLQEALDDVLKKGTFQVDSELQESEVYILAVPTPFFEEEDGKKANLNYIDSATDTVAKKLKEGDLVILESTSPPGTTKRVTDRLVEKSGLRRDQFYTAHCPERVLPGRILYELEHNDRIIGAERMESAEKAKELYKTMVKSGNIYLTDDVTAEMAKLVENSYRDVNIAFANELSLLCDKLGIDVHELIAMANKHPRVNILTPGIGVGGHCISVDPWFLVELFEDAKLIHQARKTNDYKPHWVAQKLEEKIDFDKSKTIGVLGLAFKPDIDDLRESPSEVVIKHLLGAGYNVIGCEPNVSDDEAFGVKLYSIEECCEKADVLLLAQKHSAFAEYMPIINEKLFKI